METPMTPDEIMLHNLQAAVKMVNNNMSPALVSALFKKEGIEMSVDFIEALCKPGVLEGLSTKPTEAAQPKWEVWCDGQRIDEISGKDREEALRNAAARNPGLRMHLSVCEKRPT